jgi:hypothetical protein
MNKNKLTTILISPNYYHIYYNYLFTNTNILLLINKKLVKFNLFLIIISNLYCIFIYLQYHFLINHQLIFIFKYNISIAFFIPNIIKNK